LLGYFPVIFNNCVSFTNLRKLERPDYTQQSIEDFYWVPVYAIIIRTLKIVIERSTYGFFKRKLKKYEGDELERKIAKCSRGTFKVFYFSFMFIFGWRMVLLDTPF